LLIGISPLEHWPPIAGQRWPGRPDVIAAACNWVDSTSLACNPAKLAIQIEIIQPATALVILGPAPSGKNSARRAKTSNDRR
jgi:hypothetical protein